MKKKLLTCKNDNYNGSSCPRFLTKQNFLDFPAYEFATEGITSNCDTCGAELKWETIEVKKPLNPKLIAAIAAGVLLIGGLVFFFIGGSSDKTETAEVAKVDTAAVAPPEAEEPATPAEPVVAENPEPAKTTQAAANSGSEPKVAAGSAPKGTQSLTVGGNSYKGEVLNGKPHGMGTMYYKKTTQISPKDMKKRMAEEGDYLTGEFFEGNVVQGKLFDADNNIKEVIMIGR